MRPVHSVGVFRFFQKSTLVVCVRSPWRCRVHRPSPPATPPSPVAPRDAPGHGSAERFVAAVASAVNEVWRPHSTRLLPLLRRRVIVPLHRSAEPLMSWNICLVAEPLSATLSGPFHSVTCAISRVDPEAPTLPAYPKGRVALGKPRPTYRKDHSLRH